MTSRPLAGVCQIRFLRADHFSGLRAILLCFLILLFPLTIICYHAFRGTGFADLATFLVPVVATCISVPAFAATVWAQGDLFDLRLAPIWAVTLFIVPRAVNVGQQVASAGLYINAFFGNRLTFGWEDYALAVYAMIGALLTYMVTVLALWPAAAGRVPFPQLVDHSPAVRTRRAGRVHISSLAMALACVILLVELAMTLRVFGGIVPAIRAVTRAGYDTAATEQVTGGLWGLVHVLSVMLMLACVALRPGASRCWKIACFVLALVQAAARLPAGNRQTVLFPLIAWFIVSFHTYHWRVSLLYIGLPYAVVVLSKVLLNLRYGARSVSLAPPSLQSLADLWTSEGVMFDIFVQLVKKTRLGSLEPGLTVFTRSLSYFLPGALVQGAKPHSADYQLSVLLDLLAGGGPYGAPPTLFGGLYWYFGLIGIPLGFMVLALFLRSAQNATAPSRWGAAASASGRVWRPLLKATLFVFVFDVIRVGVLMREVLTLIIDLTGILLVVLLLNWLRSSGRSGRVPLPSP